MDTGDQEALSAFLCIWDLNTRYAQALDEKDFATWPALFTQDGQYKIISAENAKRGLDLPILNYTRPEMMRDRMRVLKESAIYTQAWERRIIGNLKCERIDARRHRATCNFAIYRTDNIDGTTSLFVVGRYEDEVQLQDAKALFRSRTAFLDTFSVPNHIGFPL
jgi:anthranilate 1,2-dioxygenase small subunit